MPCVKVTLDENTARLYRKIAASVDVSLEQLLSDALFKLAGELSLEALAKNDT